MLRHDSGNVIRLCQQIQADFSCLAASEEKVV